MDINFGFGRVLRVRWLKASAERRKKHIFVRRDDSPMALRERHDKAYALLELRRELRVAGADSAEVESDIRSLGYRWQDEDAEDKRYSYWRFR